MKNISEQKTKCVLGTVQLGMKYGLSNTHGQPTTEEAFRILDLALESGINTFDTAWAYGTAEDVLGSWIKARSLKGKVNIISKMRPHALNNYPEGTKASDIVKMELEKSLNRLGVDSLLGYLFHSPYYIYMDHVVEGLKKVKEEGLVENIGVSTYDEPEAIQAAVLGVDYIQIPYNAFDERLDATNFFDIAKENKVTVFARSPFLQGLLLMKPDDLPTHLVYLKPYLEKFISISKKYNVTPLEAAFHFVNHECRADYIVFGVETSEQLRQNMEIMNRSMSENHEELVKEIKENFKDLNRGAINPSLWSKIKR